jgi:hypothetical protein
MVFRKIMGRSKPSPPPAAAPPPAAPPEPPGLAVLLEEGIHLQDDRVALLRRNAEEGSAFYLEYNEARLKLAFEAFDEPMRLALFEIMFLLHINDPGLSGFAYTATRQDTSTGVLRTVQAPATADLYVEGAPHGVKGIEALSPVFRDEFERFVRATFKRGIAPAEQGGAIVCLQSIGSIGTISHKSGASDLDLQVIYDLESPFSAPSQWNDRKVREALAQEQALWVERLGLRLRQQRNLKRADLERPEFKSPLDAKAKEQVAKRYPGLHKYLGTGNGGAPRKLPGPAGSAVRRQLTNELMQLVKRHSQLAHRKENREQEALLKERVDRIQAYINDKYPQAEIYMFTCALDRYRAGRYTSSLEFKESSGSAYELILNYETLMPGIQLTATVPTHFVLPQAICNSPAVYQDLNTYIDFGALAVFRELSSRLVDLGPTPDLQPNYVAGHSGAVYWEAFKASSGNLPKATLNLLRYEMLLDPRFRKTIIQLIKEPDALNQWITPRPGDEAAEQEELEDEERGLPNWMLLEIEQEHELLLQDPWWVRYKTLKVGFGEPKGVEGVEASTRNLISRLVDLAFALHVRISDIFTKPGDTRTFESHREQVLRKFLKHAFPPGTPKRETLQHIFAGEIQAVNRFEEELRNHFRWSLERTQKKIEGFDLKALRRQSKEIELWYRYYEQHFEPPPQMVQRTIMHHLKFPRGRVQIGYKPKEGWFFRSLQRQSGVGKRFDTFGVLDHLPDEAMLVEGTSFLHGLVTCIVNGYYGILNQGTLRESRTALEFDAKHLDVGNALDNALAFMRPDFVDHILTRIVEFFPQEYFRYTDFVQEDRCVKRVFVFYNLWHFGRISILYRDNVNTWFCEEHDHPEIVKQADRLKNEQEALLNAEPVHDTLDAFLKRQRLYVNEVELETWVNPNSTQTAVPTSQLAKKEAVLSEAFQQAILKLHPHKPLTPKVPQRPQQSGSSRITVR